MVEENGALIMEFETTAAEMEVAAQRARNYPKGHGAVWGASPEGGMDLDDLMLHGLEYG